MQIKSKERKSDMFPILNVLYYSVVYLACQIREVDFIEGVTSKIL